MAVTTLQDLVQCRRSLPQPKERRTPREQAGLSQVELGRFVGDGVDGSTICRWEQGASEPRGNLRDYYVAALQCLAEAVT